MENKDSCLQESRKLFYYGGGLLCLWGSSLVLGFIGLVLLAGLTNFRITESIESSAIHDAVKGAAMLIVGWLSINQSREQLPKNPDSQTQEKEK